MLTSERVQQYVRIVLYWSFGSLATYGVAVPDNTKLVVVSIIGSLANLAWTVYGTRLNALLAQVSKSPDVQKVITSPEIAVAVPSDKVVAAPS